ncbi:hypothetical protein [Actinokineospora fastidiosa]|uniref:Uncharacterized protein n=1 Tax=Actinokineospora fastidiosa TaxID=1816 RepID=A0A918LH80_9PSEU|nr:hypothetical protein [Actinokineospora fastidiosa]GGS46234.1 hypothetical protein GCM10010171_46800 [Actinokineospora fastidiosa]
MFVSLVLWDLSLSIQTVASLRSHLRDYAVEAYSTVPGLHQKIWVASTGPEGETWGALYLWDTWDLAYGRPPGVSKVVELIGYPPTSRTYFGVEAATGGLSAVAVLARGVGLAYDPDSPPPPTRPAEYVPPGTPVIWRNRDRAADPPS